MAKYVMTKINMKTIFLSFISTKRAGREDSDYEGRKQAGFSGHDWNAKPVKQKEQEHMSNGL